MRKYTLIAMSVLLTLALMAPAALAQFTPVGHLILRSALGEDQDGDYTIQGNARARLALRYDSTNNDNVSARVELRLRHTGFDLHGSKALSGNDSSRPELHEAYLTFRGAWIPGLPETTATIGRFSTNLNPWVANLDRRTALRVTGLDLGPANLSLYQGWEDKNQTLSAVSGTVKVDMVEVTGAVVAFRDHDTANPDQEKNTDFAIGATLKPAEGISLTAEYAHNGPRFRNVHDTPDWNPSGDSSNAWKVAGEIATIPNMTLRASTWSTDDFFRPVHRSFATEEDITMERYWTDGHSRAGSAWGDSWMKTGFSIGLATEQAGLPIDVSFKSGKIFEDNLPTRIKTGDQPIGGSGDVDSGDAEFPDRAPYLGKDMSVIGVGTTIAAIDLGLTYTNIEDLNPVTDVTAKHVFKGTPLGGDVTLSANVRFRKDYDSARFGTDAVWKAPNGLTLGLHYANYDRVLDWNHNNNADNLAEGVNIGKPGEADGFAVTAGYQFNF